MACNNLMGAAMLDPIHRDAGRYRWLRAGKYPIEFARRVLNDTPHGIDAAVDAAMESVGVASQAQRPAVSAADVLKRVLRCRYPVCTSINPSGYGWDTPRLNQVIADLGSTVPAGVQSTGGAHA